MEKAPRAIIYARVSTAKQAEEGLPVESQLERCRQRAASVSAVVDREFVDDGISGRTTQRPAFSAALDYCDLNDIDYFICWSTSRFARNRLDAALNKRLLEKMGVKLLYASQDFGESDDAWLTEAITEIIDEQYSRTIAKDTRRSMVKNARDGFFNGGTVPFGYRSAPAGKRRRLEIVEEEAAVVRSIFRWSEGGEGARAIAVKLNAAGITKRGKPWSKQRVYSVLNSDAVTGNVVFSDGEERIVTKSHPAIIDQEEFSATQIRLNWKRPQNDGGRHRSEALFAGMVKCGYCGEAMVTESATGRAGTYRYYQCRGYMQGVGCSSQRRRVEDLDKQLMAGALEKIFTLENCRWVAQDLLDSGSAEMKAWQDQIDALGAESQDVERRLRRLFDTIEAGAGLSIADVAPRIKELRKRQEEIKLAADELESTKPQPQQIDVNTAMKVALAMREVVETASPKKVREFLAQVVKKASILETEAVIEYWPERLVSVTDSQCVVSWLPGQSSLRTTTVVVPLLRRNARRAA